MLWWYGLRNCTGIVRGRLVLVERVGEGVLGFV